MTAPELTNTMREFVLDALPDWRSTAWLVEPVHNGGSGRLVLRLRMPAAEVAAGPGPGSFILLAWDDQRPDNDRFLLTQAILKRHGVRVPDIVKACAERRLALVEDLGTLDLWGQRGLPWPQLRRLYLAALDAVAPLHAIQPEDLTEEERGGLMPGFDSGMYRWEQEYFFERCLAPLANASATEIDRWQAHPALQELADRLGAGTSGMVHRDFQSQNLMLRGGEVVLVDFQGLRSGWAEYDIASLLCDPYVAFGQSERAILLEDSARMRGHDPADPTFRARYFGCAAQRLMQALGAYGNLGLNCGKPHFLASIPPAVRLLRETLSELPDLQWMETALRTLPSTVENLCQAHL